jgi:hypothetical protein
VTIQIRGFFDYVVTAHFEKAPDITGEVSECSIVTDKKYSLPKTIEYGESFKIKTTAKTYSDCRVQMGLVYRITKPNGEEISGQDWSAMYYTNGQTHEFSIPGVSFWDNYDADQAGTWTISLMLYFVEVGITGQVGEPLLVDEYMSSINVMDNSTPGDGDTSSYELKTKVNWLGVTPGGSIDKVPDKDYYSFGEIVQLTADPLVDMSMKFSHWELDGVYLSYGNPINFMVMDNCTIKAVFEWK